jgi:ATP-dependent Clp protease ATP-binding subunit ClpC
MWQRFTEMARKAVFYAQEEAQKVGSDNVSTEHLLLGLLRDENCLGTKVLADLGIETSEFYQELTEQLTIESRKPSPDMTLTPRAKMVIDLAYDEARNLNNNYIGTEHLLLGLIRQADGIAGRNLDRKGISLEAARRRVMELQDNPLPPPRTKTASNLVERTARRYTNAWSVLHLRKQRMTADFLCLLFLYEPTSNPAAAAIIGCGADLPTVRRSIEQEIQFQKTPEEIVAGFPTASDLLALALLEAEGLDQELNGSHFLLGALREGDNATAQALQAVGIHADQLRSWIEHHP